MSHITLNDKKYLFRNIELYQPNPNYQVNEKALQESITRHNILLSRVQKPNEETINAMHESEKIAKDSSVKGYSSVDELFENLDN